MHMIAVYRFKDIVKAGSHDLPPALCSAGTRRVLGRVLAGSSG